MQLWSVFLLCAILMIIFKFFMMLMDLASELEETQERLTRIERDVMRHRWALLLSAGQEPSRTQTPPSTSTPLSKVTHEKASQT